MVTEYEVEFLRLSRYVSSIVATEQDKCVRFKNRLRYDLKIQVEPHQERVFETLVERPRLWRRLNGWRGRNMIRTGFKGKGIQVLLAWFRDL